MAGGSVASSHRDDQDNPGRAESKASKRRCVQSACVPCRKRKSKCDGGTPVCATCTAVYKTPCFYDPESESRRSKTSSSAAATGTKRDVSAASSSNQDVAASADFLLNSLRDLPEEHVLELLSHIRSDPKLDVTSLAESWRKNVILPRHSSSAVQSLENDLSDVLGKPSVTPFGRSRHFGHSSGLGLVPEDENFGTGVPKNNNTNLRRKGTTWTSVTNDLAFVEELLALYFTWSHPFYVIFSRECFYKDFRVGREKYCSSLLVNAICAYACHFTDNPRGRTVSTNFRTAGDHFFEEAKRLLYEDESPNLTTVQALCVMSMREPSTGRDTSGFSYIGRCIHMCVELGLHLNSNSSPELELTPSEIEVRKVTFWGCFTVDTVWSVCTGRIAQLPRAAITLQKPVLDEAPGLSETYPAASRMQPPVVTTALFLQEFATLSELINDNNYMYYAPKERTTSVKVLDCYYKYQAWYRNLNPALAIVGKKQPEPHILVLHMLYHTVIVHLFRPLLKMDLLHSDVSPRTICIEAANKASEIIRRYRQLYDFRVAHLAITHVLLSVCIVHLLYSKDDNVSHQNLVEGLQGLEDMHKCHYFGARCIRILHGLSRMWNLPWPKEFRDSSLVPQSDLDRPRGTLSPPADPLLIAPNTVSTTGNRIGHNLPFSPMSHGNRRESLSMFNPQASLQLATHPAITRPGSVPAQHHSPTVGHAPTQFSNPLTSYQYPQTTSIPSNVPATITSPTADTAETLFWNPISGMPGPILPRNNYQQISPMGLDSVLQSSDMGDRLGRDGFKISEDWQSSHVNGFTSGNNQGFVPSSNNQPGAPSGYMHRSNANYGQQPDGVGYQQQGQHPHGGQEEYDGGWYPGSMS